MGFKSFTISPASKASKRVMAERAEIQRRRQSVDSNATASTIGELPAKDVAQYYPAPLERWTCANRIG